MMLPLTLGFMLWFGPVPTLADLEFMAAVEAFVMAEPGTAAPEPYRGLIDRLGADCFRCREIASRKLQRAVGFNPQWLFWGRRHHDAEARLRSNAILRRTNPCRSCGGSGLSRHYRLDFCSDCGGIGSVWVWSAWD